MPAHDHAPNPSSCSEQYNEAPVQPPNFDNFYTPQNKSFYDQAPYKPLRKEPREIRLVSLSLAQRGQGHLELRLCDNVPLTQPQNFYALSYAAGDHTQTEVIHIASSDSDKVAHFNAFSNLAKALRAVRDFEDPTDPLSTDGNSELRLWVDQICINQSDPDERAHQVAHMQEIYQSASTTIVYLGDDPHEGRAIRYLSRTARYCDLAALPPDCRDIALDQASRWMVRQITNSDHLENWNALYSLLGQPWWDRGWICQEAIVSRNPTVLYGSLKLDFNSLAAAVQAFLLAQTKLLVHLIELTYGVYLKSPMYQHLTNLTPGVNLSHAGFIVDSWIANGALPRKNQPSLEMELLLRQARKCKTGDPRDRVYAFIGLADPAYGIVPDYKATVAEVFINAAARIMIKEQSLDMVFEAMDNIPHRTPNLPTWVADWSCPQRRRRYLFRIRSFSSSAGYKRCITFTFPQAGKDGSFWGRILRIRVLRLDKISVPELFLCAGSEQDEKVTIMFDQWRSRTGKHLRSFEHADLCTWGTGPPDAFTQVLEFGGASPDFRDMMLSCSIVLGQQKITPLNVLQSRLQIQKESDRQWPFFATPNGYMGRASPGVRHDDELFIGLGASVPMVLRKVEGRNCYTFVGEAYVHGMMNGEAIKLMEKGKLRLEEVDII